MILVVVTLLLFSLCCACCCRRYRAESYTAVPRTIMLTTRDKSQIPQYILDQYAQYAPEYRVTVYDDEECKKYLKQHYPDKVVQKFDSLKSGAHKADLFRYAYLYREGGCYMDVKTILTRPLREVFGEHEFYLVRSLMERPESIYNGVIVTPPSNPYIRDLLNDLVDERTRHSGYLRFVNHAYDVLADRYAAAPPKVGVNRMKHGLPNLYLMKEHNVCVECDGRVEEKDCDKAKDRYNYCVKCVDEHNDVMFKVRDPNYHKTWK